MAKFSYIFGDILTGTVIQEIALNGVSMTRGFGGGDFRGSFQLDQTGKNNRDLLAATEEGRSFVVFQRDDVPLWGGFVKVRTYQSQAKVFQLYCQSWELYPSYRFIRSDFENLATEQRNIFLNLWTAMMADPNSPQVTLPSSFATEVAKDVSVRAFEFKTYREVMDTIANADDGFDWSIDIQQNISGTYPRVLRIGYPTLGSTVPIDFDYDGQIINYWRNGSIAGRGTHIYGLGAGEGSTILSQEVIHSDLLSAGFPRYDIDISFKSINDQSTLTGLTVQAASTRKPGVPIYTVELKGDREPEFGSYGLGDAARIHFHTDPAHVDPITQTLNTRILGWEYYPTSDEHTETVRLVLEGED